MRSFAEYFRHEWWIGRSSNCLDEERNLLFRPRSIEVRDRKLPADWLEAEGTLNVIDPNLTFRVREGDETWMEELHEDSFATLNPKAGVAEMTGTLFVDIQFKEMTILHRGLQLSYHACVGDMIFVPNSGAWTVAETEIDELVLSALVQGTMGLHDFIKLNT